MHAYLPKIIAIVRREDYDRLRQILPGLPADFPAWIQRRLLERRAVEERNGRLAAVEQVDVVDFARYCARHAVTPTEAALDEWATKTHVVQ